MIATGALPQGVSAKRRAILFISNDAGFFISHRLPLADAARDAGFEVGIACPPSAESTILGASGFALYEVAASRGTNALMAHLRLVNDYFRVFRQFRPDLVHLITSKPIILGGLIARLRGVPSVAAISGLGFLFTHHTPRVRLARALAMLGYRLALDHEKSHIIFQNADDRALFDRAGITARAGVSMIAGSGTDLDRFRPSCEPPGPVTVILPARMLRDKGVVEFVDAARLLKRRGVEARFLLQGRLDAANPTAVSREEIDAWTAEGCAEWRPHTDDMPRALRETHIVALPSYYREGLPKTIIDAAAAGRPTVTTDLPGCRDAIEPGKTGLLVRPRDPADLADKLQQLIENAELRVQMGKAARALAERKFDIRSVAARHLEIYHEMLSGEWGPA